MINQLCDNISIYILALIVIFISQSSILKAEETLQINPRSAVVDMIENTLILNLTLSNNSGTTLWIPLSYFTFSADTLPYNLMGTRYLGFYNSIIFKDSAGRFDSGLLDLIGIDRTPNEFPKLIKLVNLDSIKLKLTFNLNSIKTCKDNKYTKSNFNLLNEIKSKYEYLYIYFSFVTGLDNDSDILNYVINKNITEYYYKMQKQKKICCFTLFDSHNKLIKNNLTLHELNILDKIKWERQKHEVKFTIISK